MKKVIHEIRKKKSKAQKWLFDTYADYLYRISYRYLKNRELCEEVLSQSFLVIFNSIQHTDIVEEKSLKAWMRRIIINQSLMELRKRKLFIDGGLELKDSTEEYPVTTDENLLEEDLIKMVLELPDGYRTVFSLFVIEGFSHKEIGEKLGVSINTSKSQLSKARALLRKKILKTERSYETVR